MRGSGVVRGNAGSTIAASIAIIARMQTTSINVNPSAPVSVCPARDIICALMALRSVRDDVVRTVFSGRAIHVPIAPGVVRNDGAFQIRTVPGWGGFRLLDKCAKPFRGRRIATFVEVVQVEGATKT